MPSTDRGTMLVAGVPTPFYVDRTGTTRLLSYVPSPPGHLLGASPTLADARIVVPDPKTIAPFRRVRANLPVLDQADSNACVDHALIVNYMMALAQAGLYKELLSAWFLFTLTDGGVNGPTSPADALLALKTYGAPPDRLVPHGIVGPPGYSTGATAAALDYRLGVEVKLGQGPGASAFWEAVFLASLGIGTCLPVQAGPGWETDADGIVPFLGTDINHYVLVGEAFGLVRGKPVIRHRGSYGTRWGVNGCGLLTEDHFFPGIPDVHSVLTVRVAPSVLLFPTPR